MRTTIVFGLTHLAKKLFYLLTTLWCVIKMLAWGIHFRKGNRFNGIAIFKKKPGSGVYLGKKNIFNSTERSNLIGINRSCVVATHRKQAQLKIGNYCGFSGTVIGCFEKIEIGDEVICGGNTLITDSDWHGVHPEQRATNQAATKPVKIGDRVWLGVNAIVLKGVTIGENTVIAANSVVVKDIPANVMAGGNPCKVIKEI